MAAFLNIEIQLPNDTIGQATGHIDDATREHEGIQKLIKLLREITAGNKSAVVIVASRTTTGSIAASGTGSSSVTYTQIA